MTASTERSGVWADGSPLTTKAQYDAMRPYEQGWHSYMEAAWPGSELIDACPHARHSIGETEWKRGRWNAMQECQEMDD